MQNWKKGCVFLSYWQIFKGHDGQIKKNACKNAYLGSIFIPGKYVFRVCFENHFTRMISSLKYKWPPGISVTVSKYSDRLALFITIFYISNWLLNTKSNPSLLFVCFYKTEIKIKPQQLRWSQQDTNRVNKHFKQYVYYKLHESGTKGPHPSETVFYSYLFKFKYGHFSFRDATFPFLNGFPFFFFLQNQKILFFFFFFFFFFFYSRHENFPFLNGIPFFSNPNLWSPSSVWIWNKIWGWGLGDSVIYFHSGAHILLIILSIITF